LTVIIVGGGRCSSRIKAAFQYPIAGLAGAEKKNRQYEYNTLSHLSMRCTFLMSSIIF
jgi:hypothetical protein